MNIIEIIATISTLICVVLAAKEHILSWPIGIISALSLIILYVDRCMYANIVLQSVFVIQCIIGWYNWGGVTNIVISSRTISRLVFDSLLAISIGMVYGIILHLYNKNDVLNLNTFLDGISTMLALLGNWYLTRKIIQAWPLFMTYNIIVASLLASHGINLLVVLNICLFFISLNGLYRWRSKLIEE